MPSARWWRRRAGVRVQTAVIATVTVGLALGLGSALFLVLLKHNLATAIDDSVAQQAQTLADEVHRSSSISLQRRVGDSNLVQLLGSDDKVMASSSALHGSIIAGSSAPLKRTQHLLGSDDLYRVVAVGTTAPDGSHRVVIVAESLEEVETSTHTVGSLLLLGSPLLLLLVAAVTYWLSGRALRPVDAMRRRVDDIDAATLHARVALPEAHDEVWRLARTMNHMLDRLEVATTEQRRFVSDASHELRSPLAVLRTSLEVAQAHPEGTDWQRTTEIGLDETLRLERLVADLLLLARSDERGLQLRREDVDLDDLLDREAARLRDGRLTVTTDIHAARAFGDHDRLARAIRNLVDNAARHARTSVGISLRTKGSQALIEITDDGPGVPEADRERVFERFVRLDDSRARALGGTGLGLAIVRQIAQAHDGDVAFVASSRVRLTLPLKESS